MKPIPSALAAPWAIEPHWLRVVYGVWSRGRIDATALAQARAEWDARKAARARLDEPGAQIEGTGGTLRIVGDVGVLSIEGPLFRHASLFSDISGGTSYDALWRGLEAALSSRAVAKILLRVNSPGGEADGVNEFGKGIAAAATQKPVHTYVDGMCASAAYWLASQSQHIVAEETSEIGSIGVRCGIVDDSAAAEMAGIREIEIISSQSPAKRSTPVSDEIVARLQTRIDDLADCFVAAVAQGRGVDPDTVLADFGKGDVMIAGKALSAGLIDEVGNFNSTLAALAAASTTDGRSARAKGTPMKTDATIKPTAGDAPEWQCAGCNEMMGPSAKAYCAKCSEDDGDEEPDGDEDEDDARALGLDPKATRAQRLERAAQLAAFEGEVRKATGAETWAAALARVHAGVTASAELGKVSAAQRRQQLRATLERGLAGAPGTPATLSLGAIQKTLAVALRGDTKKAWCAAMEKLAADAETAKATVTAAQVLDAACSVQLSGEDVDAIGEYVTASAPVAAANYVEPHRDGVSEAAELDEVSAQVAKFAKQARATLDRNARDAAK